MTKGWSNKCPVCGKKAGKPNKFCAECGTELEPVVETSPSEVTVYSEAALKEVLTVDAVEEGDTIDETAEPVFEPAESHVVEDEFVDVENPAVESESEPEDNTVSDSRMPSGYRLKVASEDARGAAFDVLPGRPVTVGRSGYADLCLDHDERVSRTHATFEVRDGVLVVTDLGSTNGTFLGIVGPNQLHEGDQVLLGETVFQVARAD